MQRKSNALPFASYRAVINPIGNYRSASVNMEEVRLGRSGLMEVFFCSL